MIFFFKNTVDTYFHEKINVEVFSVFASLAPIVEMCKSTVFARHTNIHSWHSFYLRVEKAQRLSKRTKYNL